MQTLVPRFFLWVGIFTAAYCFGGTTGLGYAGVALAVVQALT